MKHFEAAISSYQLITNDVSYDGEQYTMFGIQCLDENNALLKEIRNISTIQSAVENVLDLLNRLQVSPIHFDEIIEDYFA